MPHEKSLYRKNHNSIWKNYLFGLQVLIPEEKIPEVERPEVIKPQSQITRRSKYQLESNDCVI